jgi:hypothetical protein
MTDLAPGDARSRSCPSCGAQNDMDDAACVRCGEPLDVARGSEAERGDLDVIEVERAAGAAGFDAVFGVDGDELVCPGCGHHFAIEDAPVARAIPATDTARADDDSAVVTCRCPACGIPGHAVLGAGADDQAGVPQNGGTQ